MSEVFTKVGKVTHPTLGKCVHVRTRAWQGPTRAGDKGKHVFADSLVPLKQVAFSLRGYDPTTGELNATFSRSVSYSDELRKAAQARFPSKDKP